MAFDQSFKPPRWGAMRHDCEERVSDAVNYYGVSFPILMVE